MTIGEQLDALWRGLILIGTPWNLFWIGIFAGCVTLIRAHLNHYDLARARKNSTLAVVVSIGLHIFFMVLIVPSVGDMMYWRAVALFFLLLIASVIANFGAAIVLKLYRHPITAVKLRYARVLRILADHIENTTLEQKATSHEQRVLDTIKEVMEEHADKVLLFL